MDIVFGLDFDEDAGKTFNLNFPLATFLNSDIRKLNTLWMKNYIKKNKYDNDFILFSGCAPCQPFSSQNKNKNDLDPRINLLSEFMRFIETCKPDFVFIENVPGIQRKSEKSNVFINFLNGLSNNGYLYEYKVLPALWFGVPQRRERLVLIASKHGIINLPLPTHDGINNPYSTVRDYIYDLPKINAGESHCTVIDHESASLSQLNLLRIQSTLEGQGRENWPEHLILSCHKQHKGHTDVYGRLSWDKPASSLTTRCISYSNGRFGHPEQNRALSVREAASLQTFPRDYKFYGTLNSKAKQIGNAVPPLMAEAVGKEILQYIYKLC